MPKQRTKPTIYARLEKRAAELEQRKAEIEPRTVPLTDKAKAIMEQLAGIKATIRQADKLKKAELLDAFLERVVPIFDVQEQGEKKKRRAVVVGFKFFPRKEAGKIMPDTMELRHIRTGRGSCSRTR